jgi:hypothetical protein
MMSCTNFGVKIELKDPESFLLVKETLTRIGVASNKTKTLYQSAHILHKQGSYYICHFKELFKLDGKPSDISEDDLHRRNLIAKLLSDWNLLTINDPSDLTNIASLSSVKVLSFKEKDNWTLTSKYTIGNKGTYSRD